MKPNRPSKEKTEQKQSDRNDALGTIRIKIITLGDVRVGKSCLIKKFSAPNRFVSNYIPTIGVDYGVKTISKKMDCGGRTQEIKIDFFDLSGKMCPKDISQTSKAEGDHNHHNELTDHLFT